MSLDPLDALLLRDDDIVLIPFKVHRTNHHWDFGSGVQVHVHSQFSRQGLPLAERNKPPPIYNLASRLIDSVMRFDIRKDDYVADDSFPPVRGTVVFIDEDTNDVMIRVDKTGKDALIASDTPRPSTITRHLSKIKRIPTDAQAAQWKKDARV